MRRSRLAASVPVLALASSVALITLIVPLPALCVAFEIVMLGQKRMRAVLWPGMALQRLTVAFPGQHESKAGILALRSA